MLIVLVIWLLMFTYNVRGDRVRNAKTPSPAAAAREALADVMFSSQRQQGNKVSCSCALNLSERCGYCANHSCKHYYYYLYFFIIIISSIIIIC